MSRAPLDHLRRLQNDLHDARETIIHLMPEKIYEMLNGHWHCKTTEEIFKWEHQVIEHVIAAAKVDHYEAGRWKYESAVCLLCKREKDSAYGGGFAYPEGLRRHLKGWGRVNQCGVMKAAFGLALEHYQFLADREKK